MRQSECLIGKKYNRLTPIEKVDPYIYKSRCGKLHKYKRYLCLCDCGNKRTVFAATLKNGKSKSCGCNHRKNDLIIGMKFARLTVNSNPIYSEAQCNGKSYKLKICECVCECGKKSFVTVDNLKSGNTSSCGCLRVKLAANRMRIIHKTHAINKLKIRFDEDERTA